MSNDWPAGLAYQVMVLLFKKFSPDDRISRVELRTILNAVTMEVNEDLSILFVVKQASECDTKLV
jgi:hypothetical protein